jgi:hypothetical protein
LPPTLPGLADGQGFRTELNPKPKGETIMKETNTTRLDVHQAITDRIVASIEADGADTFRMPWNEAGASGLPTNIASGKHYNGINILALWVASLSLGYSRARRAACDDQQQRRYPTAQQRRVRTQPVRWHDEIDRHRLAGRKIREGEIRRRRRRVHFLAREHPHTGLRRAQDIGNFFGELGDVGPYTFWIF